MGKREILNTILLLSRHEPNVFMSIWYSALSIFFRQQWSGVWVLNCLFCSSNISTGWLPPIWLKEYSKPENNGILHCALLNAEHYSFSLAQIWKHSGHCVWFFWMPKVLALLVYKEQAKQFHKNTRNQIQAVLFTLIYKICFHSLTSSHCS